VPQELWGGGPRGSIGRPGPPCQPGRQPAGLDPPGSTALPSSCHSVFSVVVGNITLCLRTRPPVLRSSAGMLHHLRRQERGRGRDTGACPHPRAALGAPAPGHGSHRAGHCSAEAPCPSGTGRSDSPQRPSSPRPAARRTPGSGCPRQPRSGSARSPAGREPSAARAPSHGPRAGGQHGQQGTGMPRRRSQPVFLPKRIKYSAQHFCCKSLPIQAHC